MSHLYESIPPERQAAFLHNAQAAFEAAVEPMLRPEVKALGELVVQDAMDATGETARDWLHADRIGDEADAFNLKHEEYIRLHVDELAGETAGPVREAMAQAGQPDFMAMRREYSPDTGRNRADLSGHSFGSTVAETERRASQTGLQNQLWSTMAEQAKLTPGDADEA